MLTEKDLLRFKELDDMKKSKRLSPKDFAEWKSLVAKAKESARNDISWWNKYPALMRDAANVVFNEIAGTPFELDAPVNVVGAGKYLPVGMRMEFTPTIGLAEGENDAFNYQMRDLWLLLHRKYRGIGTYESSDLGIVIYAIIQLIREVARAERVYGVCSYFNVRNRSTPSILLRALGVEPDAYTGDELADFRYQLNRLILGAHRLCLPKGLSMLDAYVSANGQVFKDSDSSRALWYVYDSPYRIQFSGTAISTGSSALYLSRTATGANGLQTFNDIIADLTADINALLSNTDVARMCSDLLAALGDQGVVTLMEVPENYVVVPVREDTRLMQFHNASVHGAVTGDNISTAVYTDISSGSLNPLVIYQENNVIKQKLALAQVGHYADSNGIYHPATSSTITTFTGKPILDAWKDEVSEEDIIEMTRLTNGRNNFSFTVGGTTYNGVEIDGYGVMIINAVVIFSSDPAVPTGVRLSSDTWSGNTAAQLLGVIAQSFQLTKCDWCPHFFFTYTGTGSTPGYSYIFGDLDNYTSIDKKALKRMHDACVLSSVKLEYSIAKE